MGLILCKQLLIKPIVNMKKALFLFAFAAFSVAMQAQTSRKFTVNLTPDGAANMQVFLPEQRSGWEPTLYPPIVCPRETAAYL